MGCDIHSYAEKKQPDGQWQFVKWPDNDRHEHGPFDWRSYGVYGFLADVRNYSEAPPITPPRGVPTDLSEHVRAENERWDMDGHSHSWLSLADLLAVDYDQTIEDRRVTRQTAPNCWDGGCTANAGEGKNIKLREFLGEAFMHDIEILKTLGSPDAVRIVFWFDN